MPHQFLALEAAAEYLHLPADDLRRQAKQGAIPARQVAGRWQFQKMELDVWASRRILGAEQGSLRAWHGAAASQHFRKTARHPRLMDLLPPAQIYPELTARTRSSLLRQMTELAQATGCVNDPKDLLASLDERERLCPTAMPGGVALLHPRHHEPYLLQDSFVLLGRTIQSLPFGAPDGGETNLFFLLCCQNDRLHLHLLARLCMMCTQTKVIPLLRLAEDRVEMLEALQQAEQEVLRLIGAVGAG